jgi:hypothetical protein
MGHSWAGAMLHGRGHLGQQKGPKRLSEQARCPMKVSFHGPGIRAIRTRQIEVLSHESHEEKLHTPTSEKHVQPSPGKRAEPNEKGQ